MDVGVAACYQLGTGTAGQLHGQLSAGPACSRRRLTSSPGTTRPTRSSAADLALAAEFIVARVAARIIVSQ